MGNRKKEREAKKGEGAAKAISQSSGVVGLS